MNTTPGKKNAGVSVAKKNRQPVVEQAEDRPKDAVNCRIDAEIAGRARAAHILMYGKFLQQGFSDFMESAFLHEIERIEQEHNGGQKLEPIDKLRAGRKI